MEDSGRKNIYDLYVLRKDTILFLNVAQILHRTNTTIP